MFDIMSGPYSVGLGLPASLLVSEVQLGPADLSGHKEHSSDHEGCPVDQSLVADAMLVEG